MSLTNMQQQNQGAKTSGHLLLTQGLYASSDFNGTVSTSGTLRFIVAPYPQYLPLLFIGQINKDGSISGTYCSEQNNQCDYGGGGYGTVAMGEESGEVPRWDRLPQQWADVLPMETDLRTAAGARVCVFPCVRLCVCACV